jgi:chloramphenicol O-acetyltransferase
VADSFNNRIQKFKNDGSYIRKWGTYGSGDGQFHMPGAVATEYSSTDVFVADTENDRIQKFTNEGDFIRKWGLASL